MSFEGIVQIAQESTPAAVNRALTQGWELLAVNALGEGLVYTIGRRAPEAVKPPSQVPEGGFQRTVS